MEEMKMSLKRLPASRWILAIIIIVLLLVSGAFIRIVLVNKDSDLMASEEIPSITAQAIRKLTISKNGNPYFDIAYEPKSFKSDYEYWNISIPYKSLVTVNTETMYQLFDRVVQLDFSNKLGESHWVLADYGLDNPRATIQIDYYKQVGTVSDDISIPNMTSKLAIGSKSKDGYYVKTDSSNTIYLMSVETIEGILNSEPYDYILKVCSLVRLDTVNQVDIVIGKEKYQLKIKEKDLENKAYFFGKESVDQDIFETFYTELMSVFIQEEMIELKDMEDVPYLTIKYNRNSKNVKDVTLKFLPYNDVYYRVNVNGKEFFLVNKADVDKLITLIQQSLPNQ